MDQSNERKMSRKDDYPMWWVCAVVIGSFSIGAIAGAAIGYVTPNYTTLIVGVIFLLGYIAINLGKGAEFEYGLALALACINVLFWPPTFPITLGVPGGICGFFWGIWICDLIFEGTPD